MPPGRRLGCRFYAGGAGALLGTLDRELNGLTDLKGLESTGYAGAMEEVFDAVATLDKTKASVLDQPANCSLCHCKSRFCLEPDRAWVRSRADSGASPL